MKLGTIKLGLAALALGLLGACASVEAPTRNAPLEMGPLAPAGEAPQQITRDYALADLVVVVPRELEVSERNGYYPFADIVWRGDPVGDRHAQIEELFRVAGDRAAPAIDGSREVIAQVQIVRFHGVTERTRYSVGGVYNMVFDLTVLDAQTGQVLEPARRIVADLPAPGGQAALELERAGQTERVRVLDFLTYTLGQELGERAPGVAI